MSKIICAVCGITFATKKNVIICGACRHLGLDTQRRMCRERLDKVEHPCPYCGILTHDEYCAECRREGFDNVHKMFGSTNGWDKRKKSRPATVSKTDPRRTNIICKQHQYEPVIP